MIINYAKTAIQRTKPSSPLMFCINEFNLNDRILDFGCGRGEDVRFLRSQGFNAFGFDPYHDTEESFFSSVIIMDECSIVLATYVLNTIDSLEKRKNILQLAWESLLPQGRMFVSCRNLKAIEKEAEKNKWEIFNDGFLTRAGTFQKGFDKESFIECSSVLNCSDVEFIQMPKFIMGVYRKG